MVICLALLVGATTVGGAALVLTSGSRLGGGAGAPKEAVPVVPNAQVAPLQGAVPPDVLAVGTRSIDSDTLQKISRMRGVRDVLPVDGGAVQLQGRRANAFGVDPARFRSWAPPDTARRNELWTSLTGDAFVVSDSAGAQAGLREGMRIPVVARSSPFLRVGGAADLGLPGVDLLVNADTSKRLGLVRRLAVLVNAPGADTKRLRTQLEKLLGDRSQVLDLQKERKKGQRGGRDRDQGRDGGRSGKPSTYLDLYKQAAATCSGLQWSVLAAIGQVESGHGRNMGPSSAGALGPMQFIPETWKSYGSDGDGDGKADIMNPYDAVPSAARYLCEHGAGGGGASLRKAIWHYNHSDEYVRKVLSLARSYSQQY